MRYTIKLTGESGTVEFPAGRVALWDAIDASVDFPETTKGARRDYALAAIAAERAGMSEQLGIPDGTIEDKLFYLADRYDIDVVEVGAEEEGEAPLAQEPAR